MRNLISVLALVALCLGAVACDEDNPVKPEAFKVTLKVVDTDGAPVEGLRVGLVNDTPFFPDGQGAAKAAVVLQFRMVEQTWVRIAIKDVEAQEIRVLIDDELVAGDHQIIWNGRDFEDEHQPSGRYTVHMVVRQNRNGEIVFQDSTDMFLGMLDSSRVPTGYTDAEGLLILKDKKLFPHLYDLPDMTATDENAEVIGTLSLTSRMRISLADETAGGTMRFTEDLTNGTFLELVWDPPPPVTVPAGEIEELTEAGDITVPQEIEYRLGPVYPNPFN